MLSRIAGIEKELREQADAIMRGAFDHPPATIEEFRQLVGRRQGLLDALAVIDAAMSDKDDEE